MFWKNGKFPGIFTEFSSFSSVHPVSSLRILAYIKFSAGDNVNKGNKLRVFP